MVRLPSSPVLLSLLVLGACAAPVGQEDALTTDAPTGQVASPLCMPGLPCDPPPGGILIPTVAETAAAYANFDINGDGTPEINSLSLMSFEPATPQGTGTNGLVIVFVNPQLLAQFPKSLANGLTTRLTTFRDDLVAEGYHTRFLLADVYSGPIHQDGRTLLALRRFLKDVRLNYPLRGATFVGSFPEATIYRRAFHRTSDAQGNYFTLIPEQLNSRGDLVLGDLDGNWESLYQQNTPIESLSVTVPCCVAWPYSGQFLSGTVRSLTQVRAEDVFYVRDDYVDRMTASQPGGPVTVYIQSTAQRNPEMTAADAALPNPQARPEITVSRLSTKGIAVNPVLPPDLFGRLPLDESTQKPQTVEHDTNVTMTWTQDPILEQRILIDYFDRNHGFRTRSDALLPYRTSALRGFTNNGHNPPATINSLLVQADPWHLGPSVIVDNATKTDFVNWLKTPAVLRGLEAGTNEVHVGALPPASYPALETALGGRVWNWRKQIDPVTGHTLHVPTADNLLTSQWQFGRTLWENRMLVSAGNAFYYHGGRNSTQQPCCDRETISYDDPTYSHKNNAESLLFFDNGLAEYARGNYMSDPLTNVGASIPPNGRRFGGAWIPAFVAEGQNAALKPGTNADARVLRNKRTYAWTLLGDFTLKIQYL